MTMNKTDSNKWRLIFNFRIDRCHGVSSLFSLSEYDDHYTYSVISYLEVIIQLKRNVMFEIFTNAHPRTDVNKTSLG